MCHCPVSGQLPRYRILVTRLATVYNRSGIWSGRDIITVDKATVDAGPFMSCPGTPRLLQIYPLTLRVHGPRVTAVQLRTSVAT